MKKTNAYKFFNKDYSIKEYSALYKKLRLDIRYPSNVKREQIFIKLLKKYKPKKILDAGCGAAMPLINIKKKGFNIIGYDKAKNMLLEAKENLIQNRLSPDLVFYDDFESPKQIKNNSVDCILGMGAFYYAKNVNKTLKNQKKKIKKKWKINFFIKK